ncbi:MAG: response regulator, partial [Pseudomonadota bacterium]
MLDEKKIYIVDDDISVRDALKTVFEIDGYKTILCETGSALLEGIRVHGNHPILLDVHMPGRSGIDVLNALDPNRYDAPIFVISGQADIPMAVNA